MKSWGNNKPSFYVNLFSFSGYVITYTIYERKNMDYMPEKQDQHLTYAKGKFNYAYALFWIRHHMVLIIFKSKDTNIGNKK